MKITIGSRGRYYAAKFSIFLITAALIAGMAGCDGDGYTPFSKDLEIRDWYDLDDIRDNVYGNHILMNDLDSTTAGYAKLASEAANGGKGWKPIILYFQGVPIGLHETFDGQGYEIRDLFINRPGEDYVGLFHSVEPGGVIQDIGVVNATVIGAKYVGGLVGCNHGTVSDSYSTGSVSGNEHDTYVGGLVGYNRNGTVRNSHSGCSVTGDQVGGLVGRNTYPLSTFPIRGIVSNSYSTGNVTGNRWVGGLVGGNQGTVNDSYAIGSVNGNGRVGGLVGNNYRGTVSDSYSTGNVTGNSEVGGLVGRNTDGTVNNSFWDTETSGQATSDGGVGKNTTEMQDIAIFSGAGWDIVAVAPGSTNTTYIWNIVNNVTYPFLSWQSVS